MKFIGFNFTKISVEKFKEKENISVNNIKISTNIDISNIDNLKSDFLKGKEEIIGIDFTYLVDYKPNFAKLELSGNVLLALDPKSAKDMIKQWKNKKISDEIKIPLFNVILKKSNIKALQLEDEMNLPLHIPLPKVSPKNS